MSLTFNAKTCAERMKAKKLLELSLKRSNDQGQSEVTQPELTAACQPSPPIAAVSQQPAQFARQPPPVIANQPTTGVATEQSVKAVQVINDSDIDSDSSPAP